MEKYLIDKYKINFVNRKFDFGGDFKIIKFPYTNSEWLTSFLSEWTRVSDLDDSDGGLITDVNAALVNPSAEIESGSQLVDIIIYQNKVDFYPDSGDLFSIPTIEFKEILLGWRDFLLTPPLDGTKV